MLESAQILTEATAATEEAIAEATTTREATTTVPAMIARSLALLSVKLPRREVPPTQGPHHRSATSRGLRTRESAVPAEAAVEVSRRPRRVAAAAEVSRRRESQGEEAPATAAADRDL